MRVLYVNHTAEVSGAEHSLLSLLGALPESVLSLVATPNGSLRDAVQELGVATTAIAGTAGSLRLHPLHTPNALARLAASAVSTRRAARRHRAELLHANSIRAGLVLALARVPTAATVVHVRDCLPPGALTTATMRTIAATATTIVANSRHTAQTVLAAAPSARVEVVYNAVDLARWDPARIDRASARARLASHCGEHELLLGVVAQLSPWKGQDTAIGALRLLREQGLDAHLLLIGSAKFLARGKRYDNRAHVERLHRLVAEAGLRDRVSWLGERDDVPELVRALDVLLLPSWEEPFGRALIEAMALEVPVVASAVGGPAEIVSDGVEGLLVPSREPAAWAAAIGLLAADARLRGEMGRAGRRRVQEAFTAERHAAATMDLYERALARVPIGRFIRRAPVRT